MANFHGFFTEKYHEYGIKISWKKHRNPLNIQRFRAHEKTLTNKKPTKVKPTMFFFMVFNNNEKAMNWKAIFHGVRIYMYGVFMGVFKFTPHKKPRVFRERLNINGSWKMTWLLMTFSLPMNYAPGLFFMGKTEAWPPWKFSLKLLSTVKSNTSLRICWLVKLKLYTCSNNPNPK